ncbi:formyltransferase family protein [Pseudoalteromonas spongiae]|uniref:formyltransferase family protein n=1 Tax=Pseudoalteromonas spongiae TaxID=298657 RepID=UPI001E334B67|nr:formyltransferase family protein [Pseudoalteromonas spongiae]
MAQLNMKVVYFGNNLFSNCLAFLIKQGLSVEAAYINDIKENASFVKRLCDTHKIMTRSLKPTKEEFDEHIKSGVTLFVVADYGYRLPITNVKYAFNIHPSLLPKGRGPTPLTYLVDLPEFAGVSLHKLTDMLDGGDILLQEQFEVEKNESISSLMVKSSLLAESLLQTLLNDLETIYESATPQEERLATYWKLPSIKRRIMSWRDDTQQFRQALRQYGHFGILVELNDQLFIVSHLEVTDFKHDCDIGSIIFEDQTVISIAINGGYVVFTKNNMAFSNSSVQK